MEKSRVGDKGEEVPFKTEPSLAAAAARTQLGGRASCPNLASLMYSSKAVKREVKVPFITYWLYVSHIHQPTKQFCKNYPPETLWRYI